MKVALGGTFDPVHDGHRALFERAFERGSVTIGLTSDELAPKTRSEQRPIRPYDKRYDALATELESYAAENDREYTIQELDEPTGIATEAEFEVLVVSPETKTGGKRINEIRRQRGLEQLELDVVDFVYAEDDEIITSTRILRGEIDEHGNVTPERESQMKTGTE